MGLAGCASIGAGNADALGEVGSEVCPQEANSSVGGILARATVKGVARKKLFEEAREDRIFLVPYVLGLASGGDMVKFFQFVPLHE